MRANYLLYLSKREQERTSDALDEKRISNVAIAVPPVLPILPWVGPILVLLLRRSSCYFSWVRGQHSLLSTSIHHCAPQLKCLRFSEFRYWPVFRSRPLRRSRMVLDYYNLKEQPFGVTPDPRYLYPSPTSP